MPKVKIIKAVIAAIESNPLALGGRIVTDTGHKVTPSIAKNTSNKVGDVVEYVAYQGTVVKRFQAGRTQWLAEVPAPSLSYKQI